MKTIHVEKKILENERMDVLLKLNAMEYLRIQDESDGKRCIGYVDLKGEYMVEDVIHDFHEFIECDIFAPSYKLMNQEFTVRLVDVNGEIDAGLMVNLSFEIDGLNEEDELKLEDEELDLLGLEDLFEENENMVTHCTLIVAKNDDTYETIAERFHVGVDELKKINNFIEIRPKQCILIPKP